MSSIRHEIFAVVSKSFCENLLPNIWSQMCFVAKVFFFFFWFMHYHDALIVSGKSENHSSFPES